MAGIAVLDRVFPEFEKLFSDPFIRSARELLRTAPLPEEIVKLDLWIYCKALSGAFFF